jgi:hypothetical protein
MTRQRLSVLVGCLFVLTVAVRIGLLHLIDHEVQRSVLTAASLESSIEVFGANAHVEVLCPYQITQVNSSSAFGVPGYFRSTVQENQISIRYEILGMSRNIDLEINPALNARYCSTGLN